MDELTETEKVFVSGRNRPRRTVSQNYLDRSKEATKQTVENIAGMLPGVGTAMTAKDIEDELNKENPSLSKLALMVAGEAVGLVPGLGTVGKSVIKQTIKKSDDVTKLNQDKVIDEISEVKSASNPKPVKISNKQKTVKAYKLFKTNDKGDLYPLFVKMEDNKPIAKGKWIKAEEGSINLKTGKVKSSIGDLAYRPGFHAGDLPIATHIGGKIDLKTGQRLKGSMPPNIREENQVWAEVEMLDEVDWQSIADKRARIKKDGTPDIKTAHITDQVPFGGFYRYKTNPNMTGNWLIGGELKVKKVLSSNEVKKINNKAGVSDLPKLSDLGIKFNKGGTVMNKQMEMAFMQQGGLKDDGMKQDPISGNPIPNGSMAEEVRDDIPAQLSEGEYVVPADVVRYYGVKHFEDIRNKAKTGLQNMEKNGRIGGEPVPVGGPKAGPMMQQQMPQQQMANNLSQDEMNEIKSMVMNVGGFVEQPTNVQQPTDPYQQQNTMYKQPMAMADGGFSYYNPDDMTATTKAITTASPQSASFSQPTQTIQPVTMAVDHALARANCNKQGKDYDPETRTCIDKTPEVQTGSDDDPRDPPKTGDGESALKNWGKEVDWSDPLAYAKMQGTKIETPGFGGRIAKGLGFAVAGLPGAAVGDLLSTSPAMNSLANVKASKLIAEAQGITDFTEYDEIITDLRKKSSSLLGGKFSDFITDSMAQSFFKTKTPEEWKSLTKPKVTSAPISKSSSDSSSGGGFSDTAVQIIDDKEVKPSKPVMRPRSRPTTSSSPKVTQTIPVDIAKEQESSVNVGGPGFRNKGGLMRKKKTKGK